MIPARAVEAAAKEIDAPSEPAAQEIARRALEAAAPHMLNGATVVDQTVELAEIVRACDSAAPLSIAEAVVAAGYRKAAIQ